jgi:hypothetical protein
VNVSCCQVVFFLIGMTEKLISEKFENGQRFTITGGERCQSVNIFYQSR